MEKEVLLLYVNSTESGQSAHTHSFVRTYAVHLFSGRPKETSVN